MKRVLPIVGLAIVLALVLRPWQTSEQERPSAEPEPPPPALAESTPPAPPAPALRGVQLSPLSGLPAPAPVMPEKDAGTGALEVHVTDDDGRPIDGAAVEAHPEGAPKEDRQSARTDGKGLATFSAIPAGTCWVHVAHDAFARGGTHTDVHPTQTARIGVRLERKIPVIGRVLGARDEQPIAGARVLLELGGSAGGRTRIWVGFPPLAETVTDVGGRFRVDVEPGSTVTLRATAAGFAEGRASLIRTKPGSEIVLRLSPGGTLRGMVAAQDGTPCAEAKVFVVPADKERMIQNPRSVLGPGGPIYSSTGDGAGGAVVEGEVETVRARRATTDEAGLYDVAHLALPAEVYVLAEGPDGSRGGSGPIVLDEGHPVANHNVVLEPRRAIVVRVLGPDDEPSTGVRVGVEGVTADMFGVQFLDTRGDATWWNRAPSLPSSGAIRFGHLAPGSYTVVVEGASDVPIRQPVELGGNADAEVTIRVAAARFLEGEVVDAEGNGIPQANLRWGWMPHRADKSGRFRIAEGAPENRTLEAWSRWHLRKTIGVEEISEPIRVVLRRRPVITGQLVRFEGGDTLRDHLWVVEQRAPGDLVQGATVDEKGRFRYPLGQANEKVWLRLLPRGAADVLLGPFLMAPGIERDVGRVQLDPGRLLEGRVIDEAGRPIGGARVRAARPGIPGLRLGMFARGPEAATADDGTFRIERVHRGEAVVRATHANHAPTFLDDAGRGEVTIVMPPPSFVDGRLVGADGRPLAQVGVSLGRDDSAGLDEEAYAQTDEEGRFRLGPLSAGSHRLEAFHDGKWRDLGVVHLEKGGTTGREWTLP